MLTVSCDVVFSVSAVVVVVYDVSVFFFKQKTAYELRISDWSSDVCSSDLLLGAAAVCIATLVVHRRQELAEQIAVPHVNLDRIETGFARQFCAGDKLADHGPHLGLGHRGAEQPAAQDPGRVEAAGRRARITRRQLGHKSEEHKSELQSLMPI